MPLPDPPLTHHTEPEKPASPPPPKPEHRRSWDDVVEDSFPASDPPPTPIRIGSSEHTGEEDKK
jgi:hypothetical protein